MPVKNCNLIDVRSRTSTPRHASKGRNLIRMRTVPAELQNLDARADEGPLIVYCHHGLQA